jgi:hypothetical protein
MTVTATPFIDAVAHTRDHDNNHNHTGTPVTRSPAGYIAIPGDGNRSIARAALATSRTVTGAGSTVSSTVGDLDTATPASVADTGDGWESSRRHPARHRATTAQTTRRRTGRAAEHR